MQTTLTLDKQGTIAKRFTLEHIAGSGGMGTVYRAHDEWTGKPVALKLLNHADATDLDRFEREATVLSMLSHPGIVGYVAHGLTESGAPYLAMQWLDGEDLAHFLSKHRLGVGEGLLLMKQAAAALQVAHARGIVHRDIKPSNLFLRNGRTDSAVLLDFGVARYGSKSRAMTGTGTVVGTLEYMAPEQARGEREVLPAADIFSLGCTLYECLTGSPPFASQHIAAVLAKILYEEPALLRRIRPELPESVERLVARMLAKLPAGRPADASALLEEISCLTESADSKAALCTPEQSQRPFSGAGSDQGLVSVILITPESGLPTDRTQAAAHPSAVEATAVADELQSELARAGAHTELLADGSLVVTIKAAGSEATDQVANAARCALLLRERWPSAYMVVTTGRGAVSNRVPIGDALERAGKLLLRMSQSSSGGLVILDETTAGLLDGRFAVDRTEDGDYQLVRSSAQGDATRPLLGRPTPCVGRESELAMLQSVFAACVEDQTARAIVVKGAAGSGKSRLRHEFLRRLETSQSHGALLLARAEPMRTYSSYHLIVQAVHSLLGIRAGMSSTDSYSMLCAHVAKRDSLEDGSKVIEFTAELCGFTPPGVRSPRMVAARQDPRIMAEQLQHCLIDLLRAECAVRPILLILDDVQWADTPTVKLIGIALSELRDQPFMVLALARPEVEHRFPGLWAGTVVDLPLRALPKRACEQLVSTVLGARLAPGAMTRIVEQSAGNPLFLEELIRAIAEGKGNEVPDTVMAMLQARIGRLDTKVRHLLLSASVFGLSFRPAGVELLLGLPSGTNDLDQRLYTACQSELFSVSTAAKHEGQPEYRFRHPQLREAAYNLLTAADKQLLHRQALQYLKSTQADNPELMAEHAASAGDAAEALSLLVLAAERSLHRNSVEEALRLCSRALDYGPVGSVRGLLLGIQILALVWSSRWEQAGALGSEALSLLPAGSAIYCKVVGPLCLASLMVGKQDAAVLLAQRLIQTEPAQEAISAYAESMAWMLGAFSLRCMRTLAAALFARLEAISSGIGSHEELIRGWTLLSHCEYLRHTSPAPARMLELAEEGASLLKSTGDLRTQVFAQDFWGQIQGECGDHLAGEQTLRDSLKLALRLREPYSIAHAKLHLAAVLAAQSAPAKQQEALQITQELITSEHLSASFRSWAHALTAEVLLENGQFAQATHSARNALSSASVVPLRRMICHAILIKSLLGQGQIQEARTAADTALTTMGELGGGGYAELDILLSVAEALHASGATESAAQLVDQSLMKVEARAAAFSSADAATRYRQQVRIHLRLYARQREWR